eukprot:Hpha_TRINITY_DN21758_c0_g1::TRINITY_DN21758_c0_g1_i1::g.194151::m.194151
MDWASSELTLASQKVIAGRPLRCLVTCRDRFGNETTRCPQPLPDHFAFGGSKPHGRPLQEGEAEVGAPEPVEPLEGSPDGAFSRFTAEMRLQLAGEAAVRVEYSGEILESQPVVVLPAEACWPKCE